MHEHLTDIWTFNKSCIVILCLLLILLLQSLLKKHDAFESDLEVHRARVGETEDEGQRLISDVSQTQDVNETMYYLICKLFRVTTKRIQFRSEFLD